MNAARIRATEVGDTEAILAIDGQSGQFDGKLVFTEALARNAG